MTGTDDRLEQALVEDAQRWRDTFTPPSLDAGLARLERSDRVTSPTPVRMPGGRGWWRPLAVAAAVLLVLGGILTVAQRQDGAARPSGIGHRVELPQTWTYRGTVLTLLRQDKALSAQVADRSSTTLSVMVRSGPTGELGTSCHPLAVPVVVSSDARRIVVAVGLYATSGPSLSMEDEMRCEMREGAPVGSPVTLDAPLGSREVTDAESGSPTVIGETSRVPTLASVPRGFVPTEVQTVPGGTTCDPSSPEICVSRSWRRADEVLTLSADPELHPGVGGQPSTIILQGTVHGRPATASRYVSSIPDAVTVQWREAQGQLWRVQLVIDASAATPTTVPTHRVSLTPQELLTVAQSFVPRP